MRRNNPGISPADAKAMADEHARKLTCNHCGYDPGGPAETREELSQHNSQYTYSCTRHQQPPPDPVVLCDDCAAEHTPAQDFIDEKRESDSTYVRFECGAIEVADTPDPATITDHVQVGWTDTGPGPGGEPEPIYEEQEIELPHQDLRPRIPAECECGAAIDEVL